MSKIENAAVIGSSWGDEGKAKIINYLAKDYKYICRFAGSSNAGHTLYFNGKKVVRHLLPSADFTLNQHAFLASGMVINPDELLKEVEESEELFPGCSSKIIVDPDAFVITKEHLEEDKQNVKDFGSTGKGVSVAYRDKIYRKGKKIKDLLENNPSLLQLKRMGIKFKYNLELYEEFKNNPILFEGAQAILLDLNAGTYPYVTSGECTPAGIFNSGFSYAMPTKIYGITKAYVTRVGHGPFPTKMHGEEAEKLRKEGVEFGATTNRPRDVGWLDLPALKYACIKGGINSLVLTKADILNSYKTIKVATSYKKPIFSGADFFDAEPIYEEISGWEDAKQVNKIKHFIDLIENYTGIKVEYLSTGPNTEDIIKL